MTPPTRLSFVVQAALRGVAFGEFAGAAGDERFMIHRRLQTLDLEVQVRGPQHRHYPAGSEALLGCPTRPSPRPYSMIFPVLRVRLSSRPLLK